MSGNQENKVWIVWYKVHFEFKAKVQITLYDAPLRKHSRQCCHLEELTHCCDLFFFIIALEVFLYMAEQSSEQLPSRYHHHCLQGALVAWRPSR